MEVITDTKSGEIKHERTGETAKPHFPYPVKTDVPADDARRTQVAKWITAPGEPVLRA